MTRRARFYRRLREAWCSWKGHRWAYLDRPGLRVCSRCGVGEIEFLIHADARRLEQALGMTAKVLRELAA